MFVVCIAEPLNFCFEPLFRQLHHWGIPHRLRTTGLIKYEQLSIEGVRLDWLAHNLVCKIEFC